MELFFGSDHGGTPERQRRREAGLLEAAALGETHLNVATLGGALLSLGAFHLEPRAQPSFAGSELWRRRTGGRAVAAGQGFAVVTLTLPHRAALVGPSPDLLRPEQVMNRAVRGLLESLRALGIDPVYPGLDFVTVDRRAIAHLSFVERDDGATLFQAILSLTEPLSVVTDRLDRLDPEGIVPTTLLARQSCVTLSEASKRPPHAQPWSAATLAQGVASGYARVFQLTTSELDPEVVSVIGADVAADQRHHPLPSLPREWSGESRLATAHGRLGPVQAWLRCADGRVEDAGLCGDFIAPASLPSRLAAALQGAPATRPAITASVARVIDGDRGYVLGLDAAQVVDLLLDAGGLA